jgi:hypothetical protein
MLAVELEEKGFPKGYGPQLRNIAQTLEAVQPQLLELDRSNLQLGVDLAKKEQEFAELRLDMANLWQRHQKVLDMFSQYEPDTAAKLYEYKPKFHELL